MIKPFGHKKRMKKHNNNKNQQHNNKIKTKIMLNLFRVRMVIRRNQSRSPGMKY